MAMFETYPGQMSLDGSYPALTIADGCHDAFGLEVFAFEGV
jgi:hypothetical protein